MPGRSWVSGTGSTPVGEAGATVVLIRGPERGGMKYRTQAAALVAGTAVLGFALIGPVTAHAETEVDPNPCKIDGWFVNPDEADREPTRTYGGFVFESTDLIHHNAPAGLTTADLDSGDFTATPTPDQPSFFSVEVVNADNSGYATLRYNRMSHQWDMVTGGQLYSNADPDKLVEMTTPPKSKNVVRFGVGYTKNPAGTVKTTVSVVSFQGKEYKLGCVKPTTTPTATSTGTPTGNPTGTPTGTPGATTGTPTATPSGTATGTPSATASGTPGVYYANCAAVYKAGKAPLKKGQPGYRLGLDRDEDGIACELPTASPSRTGNPIPSPAGEDEELPVTGAGLTWVIGVGVVTLGAGLAAYWFTRRKPVR